MNEIHNIILVKLIEQGDSKAVEVFKKKIAQKVPEEEKKKFSNF